MKQTISEKIGALRELMRREGLGAFIFPSTDPHNSEYVADHWKGREWISGFNGSAGTAVVTMTSAALWTDSRYFIAAAEQLKDTEFVLMKERIAGTPTIPEWIGTQLSALNAQRSTLIAHRSTEVGIDGSVMTAAAVEQLVAELRSEGGLTLRTNIDPLRTIWTDRPPLPTAPIEIQPMQYAGKSARDKIAEIRNALRKEHADGMLVATLDDIAWTLNLRGSDVHCNPVFVSYLLIDSKKATLFVDKRKVTPAVADYLRNEGVSVADYDKVGQGLKDYFEYNILISPEEVNHTLYNKVEREIVCRPSPIPYLKAVKNEAEIEGFRQSQIRDGVAMVKFLRWLKPAVEAGGQTEMSVDARLTALRAEQPLFRGMSFDTIAGYEEHGAIVHYEATEETDAALKAEGLLLLDSGAQYQDGTTDITRTIALGPVTEEQRHVYTLVLKGHIQLAMLCFPDGASGTQLDALARKDMWAEGMNFLHGTGHGVGSYLCVHEGPQQIRMEYRPAKFHAGMTVTNEPGIYLEGRFGVRIENLMIAMPYKTTAFGDFLQFETLTLCPIDTAPIDVEMLTEDEIQWLDNYHKMVFHRLSPHLDGEDVAWLREATKPLERKKA
ncbi:aminopeptidase P family protein [Prevotella koreensis]|uniref:Aminopeptidase P family protein n=1 Tax=Prevotella koreensis TaxID=2490854 RepID=A0A3S0RBB1_9BACT|nr:aminopeptidase P family protein [Prevotella koreensis]RUL59865.1 aminopeptidase P family protein [Prevotella koreensis]